METKVFGPEPAFHEVPKRVGASSPRASGEEALEPYLPMLSNQSISSGLYLRATGTLACRSDTPMAR